MTDERFYERSGKMMTDSDVMTKIVVMGPGVLME